MILVPDDEQSIDKKGRVGLNPALACTDVERKSGTADYNVLTLTAWGPLGESVISKLTRAFSCRVRNPLPSIPV